MKLRITLRAPGFDRSKPLPPVNYEREEIATGVYRVRPLVNDIYVQSVERYDSLPPNLSTQARSAYYEFAANERNVYVGQSKIVGSGLFAGVEIPYRTVFLEYSGERISCTEAEIREKRYERDCVCGDYMYKFPDGSEVVDATREGGLARFANHSCDANAMLDYRVLPNSSFKIAVLVALKKIKKGEEITVRYNFTYEAGDRLIWCRCRSKNCSKIVQ